MPSHQDAHFPLLEGVTNPSILLLIGQPLYVFSHASPLLETTPIRQLPRLSLRSQDLKLPYGASEIEVFTCLNVGQMPVADLDHWRHYLDGLGLDALLESDDGRSTYRYLVDLAFQYHFCTILLYMGLFDPIGRREMRRLLQPSEYRTIVTRIHKSRNKFAHGNTLTEKDYLGKEDFEFIAGLACAHRSSILRSRSKSATSVCLTDARSRLHIGELTAADFRAWCEYLKQLGLCDLRVYWHGRRLLRYLVDLAFQYHICTILLYMSLFDPIDETERRRMLSDADYQRVHQRIRRTRNRFAHGKALAPEHHLNRSDFDFVAQLFQQHKKTFLKCVPAR